MAFGGVTDTKVRQRAQASRGRLTTQFRIHGHCEVHTLIV